MTRDTSTRATYADYAETKFINGSHTFPHIPTHISNNLHSLLVSLFTLFCCVCSQIVCVGGLLLRLTFSQATSLILARFMKTRFWHMSNIRMLNEIWLLKNWLPIQCNEFSTEPQPAVSSNGIYDIGCNNINRIFDIFKRNARRRNHSLTHPRVHYDRDRWLLLMMNKCECFAPFRYFPLAFTESGMVNLYL